AAHPELRPAGAHDDLALHHTRGAGDGVAVGRQIVFIERPGRPDLLARPGVQRDKAAVDRADIDLAVPGGAPAIDHAAAGVALPLAGHARVIFPELLAGAGVEG